MIKLSSKITAHNLTPIDPEAFIPQNHLVRVIDKIIDISTIIERYKGGGTSSYHPLMLLKVLIYALHTRYLFIKKNSSGFTRKYYFYVALKVSSP